VLDKHLDSNEDPSIAIRAVYGHFLVSGLRLNCCFLIFSANSMPRIVTAAVSNRLNPSIGRIRCFIRR
jgi:hypothetical protein